MSDYLSCFISYAQPDEQIAIRINQFLKANGVRTWAYYEQGKIGEWRPRIQQALDDHECIILLVSKSAIQRRGVQDENRLALADDIRPYTRRLLPILLDDIKEISESVDTPEGKELLNFVKRVLFIPMHSSEGSRFTRHIQSRLLSLLKREITKVLVIGSVSVETPEENDCKREFVETVARCVGKYLALNESKPICITTRGGGIDYCVSAGFEASAMKEDVEGRLWLLPEARNTIFYTGPGRLVEIPELPKFEGLENISTLDTRGRFLISRASADADSVIAIRGGRGVEYAFIICLAERKKIIFAPCLGGMGEKLYKQYHTYPNIGSPPVSLHAPSAWTGNIREAEFMANQMVLCSLGADM